MSELFFSSSITSQILTRFIGGTSDPLLICGLEISELLSSAIACSRLGWAGTVPAPLAFLLGLTAVFLIEVFFARTGDEADNRLVIFNQALCSSINSASSSTTLSTTISLTYLIQNYSAVSILNSKTLWFARSGSGSMLFSLISSSSMSLRLSRSLNFVIF